MLGNGVSVSIYSRGANRLESGRKGGQSISYNKEDLAQYFHLPLTEAATQLNICPTTLKKLCRNFGIQRWPYQRMTLNHGLNPEAVGSSPSFLEQQANNGLNPPSSSENSRAGTTLPFLPFNQLGDDSVRGDAYAKNNGEEDSLPFSDILDESGFLGPDPDEDVPI